MKAVKGASGSLCLLPMLHLNNKLLCGRLSISIYHFNMQGDYRTIEAWKSQPTPCFTPYRSAAVSEIRCRNHKDDNRRDASRRIKQTRSVETAKQRAFYILGYRKKKVQA